MPQASQPKPTLAEKDLAAIARWKPSASFKNRLVAALVGTTCRVYMQRLNQVVMDRPEPFWKAREARTGLLTFSNHVSLFDDPLLTACMSGSHWESLRWIGADAHNFFGSWLKAVVFNGGKCVPIVRGGGVSQPGMDFLAERLANGEWVHLFPEGGRTRHPEGRLQLPFKHGMAELIKAAQPLVLPFHHQGMNQVLPIGKRLPSMGKRVHLRFGEVTNTADDLADQPLDAITRWAEHQLLDLEKRIQEETR